MRKKEVFDIVSTRLKGYLITLGLRFEHNSYPYTREDFQQEAALAIWEAIKAMVKPEKKKDSFWKKVIRNRMIDFYRSSVKKVNRAQSTYKEQLSRTDFGEEDCYEDS